MKNKFTTLLQLLGSFRIDYLPQKYSFYLLKRKYKYASLLKRSVSWDTHKIPLGHYRNFILGLKYCSKVKFSQSQDEKSNYKSLLKRILKTSKEISLRDNRFSMKNISLSEKITNLSISKNNLQYIRKIQRLTLENTLEMTERQIQCLRRSKITDSLAIVLPNKNTKFLINSIEANPHWNVALHVLIASAGSLYLMKKSNMVFQLTHLIIEDMVGRDDIFELFLDPSRFPRLRSLSYDQSIILPSSFEYLQNFKLLPALQSLELKFAMNRTDRSLENLLNAIHPPPTIETIKIYPSYLENTQIQTAFDSSENFSSRLKELSKLKHFEFVCHGYSFDNAFIIMLIAFVESLPTGLETLVLEASTTFSFQGKKEDPNILTIVTERLQKLSRLKLKIPGVVLSIEKSSQHIYLPLKSSEIINSIIPSVALRSLCSKASKFSYIIQEKYLDQQELLDCLETLLEFESLEELDLDITLDAHTQYPQTHPIFEGLAKLIMNNHSLKHFDLTLRSGKVPSSSLNILRKLILLNENIVGCSISRGPDSFHINQIFLWKYSGMLLI